MIGFLRGKVHHFGLDYVLLDVNNVGYRINFYHPELLQTPEGVRDIYGKECAMKNIIKDNITIYYHI